MWPYHPDLLARAVPRYTSFPTAADFHDAVGGAAQAEALDGVKGATSLYLHIPYCEQICWYCGCNTGAANKGQRLTAYLDALGQDIDLVAGRVGSAPDITRVAFGGGSPNAISPLAFVRLLDHVLTAFAAGAPTLSVELDPRGLTSEWTRVLGAAGVSHASLGVQTFSPAIQHRIGRVQALADICAAVDQLRAANIASINFDLMYGLPGQTMADLDTTIDQTLTLRPERIALFGYAHVPHILPRQRRIDASALPDQHDRFVMAAHGHARLTDAGYVAVGFDHFALPHDPLAMASENQTLRRNFQGFTDDTAEVLIGLGASAISLFPDRIIQNEKNVGRYRMRMSAGQLAGALGIARSRDDRERALVIEDILCARPADLSGVISAGAAAHLLAPFVDRGLAVLDRCELHPTHSTRPYARSIAALFDPYRQDMPNRFSSAV